MKSCKETEVKISIYAWQKLEMTKLPQENGGFWCPCTQKLFLQSYGLKNKTTVSLCIKGNAY